jgi:hypothetical protein
MKKLTQIAGLAGILFLGLGLMVVLGLQRNSGLVKIHLIVGAALLLLGAIANLGEIKDALMKRSVRMGPQVLLQALLLLVVLVFIYMVVAKNNYIRDFTTRDLYTLTKASHDIGANLPGPVEIIAFFPEGKVREARERLKLYQNEFPNIKSLRFIDPDKNDEVARAEGAPPRDSVEFKYKNNKVFILKYDESDITNGLIKVIRETNPKVWFAKGHGEPGLDQEDINGLSYLGAMLKEQGYAFESIDLATVTEVPSDVAAVAVIGPTAAYPDTILAMLDVYLNKGGNLLITLDPALEVAGISNLEQLLQAYGVQTNFDVIFEPKQHMAEDKLGRWMIVTDLPAHEITEGMTDRRAMFFLARSIEESSRPHGGITVSPLAQTTPESYHKRVDFNVAQKITTAEEFKQYFTEFMQRPRLPEDEPGPFKLALAVEKTQTGPAWKKTEGPPVRSRIVVAGTSTICRNRYITVPFNHELVINAFNWLAGAKDLKFIRPPQRGGSRIYLDQKQKDMILYISVMILPELFMTIGLAVWWRRR